MVSKVETEYSNYDFEVSLEGISPKLNSIGNDPLTHRNAPLAHLCRSTRPARMCVGSPFAMTGVPLTIT